MSEEKQLGYTQQLKGWTRATIINPLENIAGREFDPKTVEQITEAIRIKMLESFRNGQKMGPRTFPKPQAQRGGERAYVR